MKSFNFVCVSCSNQLLETGVLLSTAQGPLVLCDVCRELYYIDALENAEGSAVIVVEPMNLEPEQEYDIIRAAEKRTPLKEYLEKAEQPQELKDLWGNYLPNEKNINSHFDKDLKSIIEESVTPSDIIRKIKAND